MNDDDQQYLKDAVALVTQLADAEQRAVKWTDATLLATEFAEGPNAADVMISMAYLLVKSLDAMAEVVNAWPTEPKPFDVGELPADVFTLVRKLAALE